MVDQQFAKQQRITPFGLEKPLITRLLQAQVELKKLNSLHFAGQWPPQQKKR
jgi:hypothetical protein